jgi:mono/diheme cytochrome c family protein
MMSKLVLGLVVAGAVAGAAAAQDADEGARLYADFCAVCHGVDARGGGVMTEVLTIAPPDLTSLAEGGAFPTLQVVRQIDGRDPLLAHGGDMPLFGMWFEGDGSDVALRGPGGQPLMVSRPIADLVTWLIEVQS